MPAPGASQSADHNGLSARLRAGIAGARWAIEQHRLVHGRLKEDGLGAEVQPPPTVLRGSLRGARMALWVRRATCLERSMILQRWWATRGVGLDVVIGVRNPNRHRGPMAHAWVDWFDRDWTHRFAEIRRIPPPDGTQSWKPSPPRCGGHTRGC